MNKLYSLAFQNLKYSGTCARLFEHVIRTDDSFFLENRLLFRRKEPSLQWEPLSDTEMKDYLSRVLRRCAGGHLSSLSCKQESVGSSGR